MKRLTLSLTVLILCAIALSGCGGSQNASNSTSDSGMQTEIVMLLTSMVTSTPPALIESTATEKSVEPTQIETKAPTMLPVVLVTPTPEVDIQKTIAATLNITPSEPDMQLITFTPGGEITETKGAPKATPTAAASDPILTLGEPTYKDTFDTGDNWYLGKDNYINMDASNGNLVLEGLTSTTGWRVTNKSLANGYIQLTGKMEECSGYDGFGLFFRIPNINTASDGYLYGITCDGKYSLRKWNGEKMLTILGWKSNDAILKGSDKTNRLGVMMDGYELTLYANGVKLATTTDNSYGIGGMGVFISAKETADLTALLDELDIWKQ
jgi:hypothetical protein